MLTLFDSSPAQSVQQSARLRRGVGLVTHWHNEYRAGAWRHPWPPGKPLPYGVAFCAVPGETVLSGEKPEAWPRALGTWQATGRISLTYACGCSETGARSLALVCPIHGQPARARPL
jgi:hypothetical protein